jgi:integrase
MARKKRKRSWGSGTIQERGRGLIIRWRENEIAADGSTRIRHRCEAVGDISVTAAADILRDRLAKVRQPTSARVTFKEFATTWKALVVPKYPKHSTRKHHAEILDGKLMPFFGTLWLDEITGEHVQQFISSMEAKNYAPHSIHHYHAVLSAVFATAVIWKKVETNPASLAKLPVLRPVRSQHVLTYEEARALLEGLPARPRIAVALALMTGIRRGELFALRWKHFARENERITIVEAVYDHQIDTPKTLKSVRTIPLPQQAIVMLDQWKAKSKRTKPEDFILAGRRGVSGDHARMLRDHVKPACIASKIPVATWLTFRRTWSTWADGIGASPKMRGELMGNSEEINQRIYTKVIPDTLRVTVQQVSENLCATCAHESNWVN